MFKQDELNIVSADSDVDLDEELYRLLEDYEFQWSTSYQIEQCVSGCFSSVQYTIGKIILLTVLQRLIISTVFPSSAKHLSCIFLGSLVLFDWIPRTNTLMTFFPFSFCFALILLSTSKSKGFVVTCACIVSVLIMQSLMSAAEFVAIRGIIMVLTMKLSSLAFDTAGTAGAANAIPFLAYLINPATIIFGPFYSIRDFEDTLQCKSVKEEVVNILWGIAVLFLAFLMLIYSSCSPIVFDGVAVFGDYFTAQSFRTSHYFVCFLSQGLITISGLRISTCSPLSVELPRSLVEVVVGWNISMHRYLRSYVYLKFAFLGAAASIFISFAISSLMHGLNFQISAVLLSLGFVCYFENKLRNRISKRFSMCVRARPCKNCEHQRGWACWQTILINLLFFVHSVYQLIYLGAPFDGEGASEGYTYHHTLSVWKRHHYAAHWISFGVALASICI
ncbi:unnamed protein product [Cylicocyclus nassatus]|uniref:Protein-serine O-palmitoleoyltransferase porcupine n=1 Tax=Cylicocyclus nassatus TaxID=53992 RepID=A0AA36GHH1_CYLNA|nr:unnamed protein product [Cylicocyclus nassatus]